MYLYNTTFVIEESETEWWREWMRRYYLPTFADIVPGAVNAVYKLENTATADRSSSFSCQWLCGSLHELAEVEKYSQALLAELTRAKGDKCLFFSTMMKKVEL